jgi:hypothetical protein
LTDRRPLSVAVLGMGRQEELERCLGALAAQRNVPQLEVVVTHSPEVSYGALPQQFPDVRFVCNTGQRSPVELTSRAIAETTGEKVLVTKDYCVPEPDWAQLLSNALDAPCGAAGGSVDIVESSSDLEWAFSFIDLHAFASPLVSGPTNLLTVYNVAYRRAALEGLDFDWRSQFQEAAVHQALAEQVGPLLCVPQARVRVERHVSLGSALRERYRLGRVFAAKRLQYVPGTKRWLYSLGAPLVGPLLLRRIAAKAVTDPGLKKRMVSSLGPLAVLLAARTGGEWMGYVTGRAPR